MLIVDRDKNWVSSVAQAFVPYLVHVRQASARAEAIDAIQGATHEMVVLDVGVLPLDVYRQGIHRRKRPGLIVTTDKEDFATAVDALRVGALDVLTRPVCPDGLINRVGLELESRMSSPHYLGRRLDRYLQDNHQRRDLDLPRLSTEFGISESYASLLLRHGTWGGFRRRLAFHRIARAKRMLHSTNEPLYLIAEACGFASPSRLSETFLRFVGVSPKKFRTRRIKSRLQNSDGST